MASSLHDVFRRLGETVAREGTDQELLDRYRSGRDEGAFAALVRRHGGMVWGVCRRMLARRQDAEDAFQATFLVLAKKASAIHRGHLLGNWLYGVAYRAALKARRSAARWGARRQPLVGEPEAPPDATAENADLLPLVDEELSRLPEKYRIAVVLCCLEGMTKEEAARSAGVPEGTLSSRLARGRDLLRRRLTRRGVACSAPPVVSLIAGSVVQAVPPALLTTSAVSPAVLALTRGVIHVMWLSRLKHLLISFVVCLALAGGGAVAYRAWAGEGPTTPALEPGAAQAQGEPGKPVEVPPSQQWRGEHCTQAKPLRAAVRTAEEWAKTWAVAAAADPAKTPAPKVDFSKDMVLAVFMGQRNSGGHAIAITRVVRTGDDLTVYVREVAPAPGEAADSVITHPYHLAVVPAVKGKVRFEDDPKKAEPAKSPDVSQARQWRSHFSGQKAPLRTVIRSAEEWAKVWAATQAAAGTKLPVPEVNFTKEMVLAAFLGERPTLGHSVSITGMHATPITGNYPLGHRVVVYVSTTAPGPKLRPPEVAASPCHFVAVPRMEGSVQFAERGLVILNSAPADRGQEKPAAQAPKEVKIERQWKGFNAEQEKPLRTAVRTQEEWEKIWKAAEGNVMPMPPVPKVDFERQMVLAAFQGRKPTGGHAITVTRVVRTEKGLTAYVRETVPAPGDIVTDALTSPYHFAVVPADKGPVTFENEPAK